MTARHELVNASARRYAVAGRAEKIDTLRRLLKNEPLVSRDAAFDIADHSFGYRRNPESLAREAALDGLYIVRTSLTAAELDAEGTVRAYKLPGSEPFDTITRPTKLQRQALALLGVRL